VLWCLKRDHRDSILSLLQGMSW